MSIETPWANDAVGGTKLNATRLSSYTPIRGSFANPNGNVVGSPGNTYLNTTGGAGQTLWVKETGVGTNTGWTAAGSGSGGVGPAGPAGPTGPQGPQGPAGTAGSGAAITTQDEGTTLTANTTAYNFTGTGVTASNSGGSVTVNVPGGGGTGIPVSTVTAKGDLIVATASGVVSNLASRFIGNGSVLTIDSTQATNLNWLAAPYGAIESAGTLQTIRPTLNFLGSGVTVADNTGNFSTDVTIPGTVSASYTTLSPFATASSQAQFRVTASGNYICNITLNRSMITLFEPQDNVYRTANVCVIMDSVGGKTWEVAPGTIIWDTGMGPSQGPDGPFTYDLSANAVTFLEFAWLGQAVGWFGKITTSIPKYYTIVPPTASWVNTESLGWAGVNTQNLNCSMYFSRGCTATMFTWYQNAATQCFSAALRQRLTNNNWTFEVGSHFATDGPRASFFRGGDVDYGGFFVQTSLGYVSTVATATSASGAKGGLAHETCHAMDALYYGGANAMPGAGIGNGSEPAQISSHSTLQTLHTDCINNGVTGTPPANQYEWFAEMERARRLNDNGPLGTAGTSQTIQCGDKTNAGPSGSGGTPAQRQTRFNNYMVSLSLV